MEKLRFRWVLLMHDANRKVWEPVVGWVARHLPRSVRYWVVITTAVDVGIDNPTQEVPTITWTQMLESLRTPTLDFLLGPVEECDSIVGGGPSWVVLPEQRYRCFVTLQFHERSRARWLRRGERTASVEVPVGIPVPGIDEISTVPIKEFETDARSIGDAAGQMAKHILDIRAERASILWRPSAVA